MAGSHIIDNEKAIAELSGISQNAKLFLMDRIGNNLTAIRLSNHLQRNDDIDKCVNMLIKDMKKIGLFESSKLGTEGGQDGDSI